MGYSNFERWTFLIQNSFRSPIRKKKYEEALRDTCFDNNKKSFGLWDASYGIESAAGYYTYFGVNLAGRFGRISFRNFRNSQTSFTSSGDKALGKIDKECKTVDLLANEAVHEYVRYWEAFLFVSVTPRLFANNNLIQGQKRNDSVYALDAKYVNSFVAEFEVGINFSRTTVAIFSSRPRERQSSFSQCNEPLKGAYS